MRLVTLLLSLLISLPSLASWHLDNAQSRLSFISIKKADVAEVHRFTQLSGELKHNAKVSLIVDLTSVDTHVEIRDQRMQKFLFETNLFPQARFDANINTKSLQNVGLGESAIMEISGEISLHGVKQEISTEVLIARINEQKFIVSSMQPIIIQAANFKLGAGVEKLQELAHLPSISKAVPVSFALTFVK